MTGPALRVLDDGALRLWLGAGRDALDRARVRIDSLNVFPVADADTGTNLLLTMAGAVAALHADGDLASNARAAAAGALRCARGSSGTILSEYLRGFASGLAAGEAATGADVSRALRCAAAAAYAAVAHPVEGTMLSVAAAAADGAAGCCADGLAAVVGAAAGAARAAVERTTAQLPVLAAAGVVDAGGEGLAVLLDSLLVVVTGAPAAEEAASDPRIVAPPAGPTGGFGYEVQYLLDAPDGIVAGLREQLSSFGDSVVVSGADGLHQVHVHVDDVGRAIEAGIELGRPHDIRVTRFADRMIPTTTVVAIVPAGGLADVFRAAGAMVIEATRDSGPSVAQLRDVLTSGDSGRVVVLPNARHLRPVADEAATLARADGRAVLVVPTRSPVQGLAALAVHDRDRTGDDDATAMVAAAAATRYAEVVVAAHAALTSAGPCAAGDVLGLIDDDVAVIGGDMSSVAVALVDRLLGGGGELVTVVTADDATDGLADEVTGHVAAVHPAVEVVRYPGGTSSVAVMIGVE